MKAEDWGVEPLELGAGATVTPFIGGGLNLVIQLIYSHSYGRSLGRVDDRGLVKLNLRHGRLNDRSRFDCRGFVLT